MDDEELAPERNRRLAGLLADAGRVLGLKVEVEYSIPGGRIDVVWLWQGPDRFARRLPLVGFEIESSWRTRKHIKGDVLNLIELQPALGVIVLAGSGPKVAATQEFANSLVARHASRIEIWDEAQVLALTGSAVSRPVLTARPASGVAKSVRATGSGGKYAAITLWLTSEARDRLDVSFREIEDRLGFPLPPSSRQYPAHWSGYRGSAVARAIKDAGWRARNVDLRAERATLERVEPHRTRT